jgi:RecB family endonuclease NucS
MTPGDVELLYYHLNSAVLLGNRDTAKMYLEMLRAEFNENETAFDVLRQEGLWDNLIKLGNAVDQGLTIKNFNFTDNSDDAEITEKDEDRSIDEKSLVKLICENVESLRTLLKTDEKLYVHNIEQPTQYGRIDIVLMGGDTAYLVEVKKGDARYSVISQIDKYMLDYNLKLILKLWKKVVGVVIANAYIGRVINELVGLNVIPIKYRLKNGVLKMRRLHAKKEDNDSGSD